MAEHDTIIEETTIEIDGDLTPEEKAPLPAKVEPVAKGSRAKKSMARKAEEAILGDDPKSVKTYLVWDVLLPAVKDTIADLVKKGIDALLYGDQRPSNVRRERGRSYIEYDRPSYRYTSTRERYYQDRDEPRSGRSSSMRFDDITFATRQEAERVLDNMVEDTMLYGLTTVSHFYQYARIDDISYIDNEYGWYDLSRAYVDRVRGRYVIVLPRVERIEDD